MLNHGSHPGTPRGYFKRKGKNIFFLLCLSDFFFNSLPMEKVPYRLQLIKRGEDLFFCFIYKVKTLDRLMNSSFEHPLYLSATHK